MHMTHCEAVIYIETYFNFMNNKEVEHNEGMDLIF